MKKPFGKIWYYGRVVLAFKYADADAEQYYKVVYTDGDAEDYDTVDMHNALQEMKQQNTKQEETQMVQSLDCAKDAHSARQTNMVEKRSPVRLRTAALKGLVLFFSNVDVVGEGARRQWQSVLCRDGEVVWHEQGELSDEDMNSCIMGCITCHAAFCALQCGLMRVHKLMEHTDSNTKRHGPVRVYSVDATCTATVVQGLYDFGVGVTAVSLGDTPLPCDTPKRPPCPWGGSGGLKLGHRVLWEIADLVCRIRACFFQQQPQNADLDTPQTTLCIKTWSAELGMVPFGAKPDRLLQTLPAYGTDVRVYWQRRASEGGDWWSGKRTSVDGVDGVEYKPLKGRGKPEFYASDVGDLIKHLECIVTVDAHDEAQANGTRVDQSEATDTAHQQPPQVCGMSIASRGSRV